MAGIASVLITDLFWETLGQIRGTPYYEPAVEKIRTCIANKMANREHVGGGDSPFTAEKALRGMWHCRICQSPLTILFYRIEGDTMLLGKVGDHGDYGWKGKNSKASERLAERIANAVARGHSPFPGWDAPRWSDPKQVSLHPDVPLLSRAAMERLDESLSSEFESLSLFQKRHGTLETANEEDVYDWLEHIEAARSRLHGLIEARLAEERSFRRSTPAAMVLMRPDGPPAGPGFHS